MDRWAASKYLSDATREALKENEMDGSALGWPQTSRAQVRTWKCVSGQKKTFVGLHCEIEEW